MSTLTLGLLSIGLMRNKVSDDSNNEVNSMGEIRTYSKNESQLKMNL